MKAALARHLLREARGAGPLLAVFVVCLAVGVGAVVAVAGLSDALDDAVRSEARRLLAADLAVSGRQPLPDGARELLESVGVVETTSVRELFTVAAAPPDAAGTPGPSRLANVKVVAGRYPFYGELRLEPPGRLSDRLDARSVVVAPELLEALDMERGDSLRLGGAAFRIAGLVLAEPDRVVMSFALAPRIFMSEAALERAGLVSTGSRVAYKLLARLPSGLDKDALETARDTVKEGLPGAGYYEVETYADAQPTLRRGLERVEQFIGLIALLSLMVGGVGVAQAVRAWLASRMDAIAILRSFGVPPRGVLALYGAQTLALAAAGSLIGVAAGVALQSLAPVVLGDLLRAEIADPWQPAAMLRGLLLGSGVALLFALGPLSAALRVPPLRVFRRDAEPLPPSPAVRAAAAAGLVGGVALLASAQAGSFLLGAFFAAGMAAVVGALALSAWVLVGLVRAVPRERVPVSARHGLGALVRPGAGTYGAVVALGLGIAVVLAMLQVERRITAQLGAEVPPDAPSVFLVDVQPAQWAALRALLEERGARGVSSVPMVVARLAAINGRSVSEILLEMDAAGDGRSRWALRREQRMTFLEELPEDNEVVAGELWSRPEVGEISLESDFAQELGASLGSRLTLDVQGVPVELVVTSLRRVDWGSFGINFFMVVEPQAIRDAPHTRVATARVPRNEEQALQDAVAASFPNVTVVRVRDVLERVAGVLGRLGLGVQILGGFAVLAGVAILGGAVTATALRRRREAALLKTLGFTRAGVLVVFALEYALQGLVAASVGCAAGTLLAWLVTTRVLDLPWVLEVWPIAAALVAGAGLAVVGGLLASLRALLARPAELLEAAA